MVRISTCGKHYGTDFERRVGLQASACGMLLVEHGVKVRYAGRRVIPLKSDVDFRLMHQGRCVFFDAKSRQGATLPLSSLAPAQRVLVAKYTAAGFRAGFLAEFRATDQVVFFGHESVSSKGARGSLAAADGLVLGRGMQFALPLLFG